ncbi:uncharacterized protein LOC132721968 [Ruditapes philippinarum]|uniref:uncharacterized protein LOC132721968 n=1 Tax=Ruditapes philippinarum TaxID=129788 RepID=UPI00295BC8DD|nr:uncharacterized protein LOC132721968 [Ruditapes philippinarum]
MKQEWCTGFSDGYHKMIMTLTDNITLNSNDPCQQFSLSQVKDTNLFVLVLRNREKFKCQDSSYKQCSNCQPAILNPVYQLSIPRCTVCEVNQTLTSCQCQCYCDTDLDTCHGQFNTHLNNFPTRSCFYPPNYRTEFAPSSPSPMTNIDRCPIPCVAIEDLDVCDGLEHCKASSDNYPTCIWKDDDELKSVNISRYFPTKSPPRPPVPSTTGGPKPLLTTTDGPFSPPHQLPSNKPPVASTSASAFSPPQKPPTQPSSDKSTTTNLTPPVFHSTKQTSVVAPVTSGSVIHPVSGSKMSTRVTDVQTKASGPFQTGSTTIAVKSFGKSSSDSDKGLSGGAIAALVIGLLALVAIIVFIAVKMYNKKFRRPGADESAKYRAGSSMFDSTVFLRNLDQVSINASAPNATNVPYQEMTN